MSEAVAGLRRTPLHDVHVALGARMVPFAGYEMPVQYRSIIEEHRTVRSAVGPLRPLAHGGGRRQRSRGPRLRRYAVVSDPGALEPGQAQYSMLCTDDGGIIDDLILYRTDEGYLIVCNASNREAVVEHLGRLLSRGDFDAVIDDRSERTALLAPQGPRAAELVAGLDRPRPRRARQLPLARRAAWPASTASWHAPAIPGRTASSCSVTRAAPSDSGRR